MRLGDSMCVCGVVLFPLCGHCVPLRACFCVTPWFDLEAFPRFRLGHGIGSRSLQPKRPVDCKRVNATAETLKVSRVAKAETQLAKANTHTHTHNPAVIPSPDAPSCFIACEERVGGRSMAVDGGSRGG